MVNQQLLTVFCIAAALLPAADLKAEPPIRDRVVDVIILRDDTRLLGSVIEANDADVKILLRRAWLEEHCSHILERSEPTSNLSSDYSHQVELLKAHIAGRNKTDPGELERTGFLNEQIRRLESVEQKKADLVIVKTPTSEIRRQFLQPGNRREIGFAAIASRLPDAEISSLNQIRQLFSQWPPNDIIKNLPGNNQTTLPASDRILLQADRIFGRTCRLIQFGNSWFADGDERASLEDIAATMLTQSIQTQIADLLSENPVEMSPSTNAASDAPGATTLKLESAAMRLLPAETPDVVEVTRLKLQPQNVSATVTLDLYQLQQNTWLRICSGAATASSADITAEQKNRIKNDPQVSAVLNLFASSGLAAATDGAVNIGAVVEIAQRQASQNLQQALDSSLQTVDGISIEHRVLHQEKR